MGNIPSSEKVFDFHTHSSASDGVETPENLVRKAKAKGIRFLALSDHDTIAGYAAAKAEGERIGLPILPSLEMDNEYSQELHILGLGVDPDDPGLKEAMEIGMDRRRRRNEGMLNNLRKIGIEVYDYIDWSSPGTVTRGNFCRALRDAGYAKDAGEAFFKYMDKGKPGYYMVERYTPQQTINIIKKAGGLPTVAHPCHLKGNIHAAIAELVEMGIGGLEAYYPTSTEGQRDLFLSLANRYGLIVTCGSDFHGEDRPRNPLGSAWRDVPELERTWDLFAKRTGLVSY